MDREEVLAVSRKENKNQDVVAAEAIKQGSKVAYIVGCCAAMLICFWQFMATKTINWGCWVVNFSILGTLYLVKYIKMKNRRDLAMLLLDYALCLFFAIGLYMSLRG